MLKSHITEQYFLFKNLLDIPNIKHLQSDWIIYSEMISQSSVKMNKKKSGISVYCSEVRLEYTAGLKSNVYKICLED